MMVDHAAVVRALAEHGGVPRFPKVKVTLGEPDDQGLAEMTIEGSAHATEEDVATALGLTTSTGVIRKHTPSTIGYVVSEPARAPSPGALASRGRVRRTAPTTKADKSVIEANVSAKPSRAKTAGRRNH